MSRQEANLRQRRRRSAMQARAIPVGRSWNEDEDDDEDEDDSPTTHSTLGSRSPDGYYSKGKVWTVVCIIVYIYFRFISI